MTQDGSSPNYERRRWAERGLRAYMEQAHHDAASLDLTDESVLCEITSDFLTDIMLFIGEIKLGECLMRGLRNYYVERYEGGSNA